MRTIRRFTVRKRLVLSMSLSLGLAGTFVLSPLTSSSAGDGAYFLARWEMNEHQHATVLRDASGNGFAGHIGRKVEPTKQSYHHFPRTPLDTVLPAHIDKVPDQPGLDPGFADFGVAVKFRWLGGNDRNLVQKGQGSPAGGMFKMKTSVPSQGQPEGHIKCLFRGSAGDSQVESYAHRRLDDGRWHTVRCERRTDDTAMFVDGVLVDTNTNDSGNIDNDWPISIGGNSFCEDTPTEENVCNYWHGDIGFVRMIRY